MNKKLKLFLIVITVGILVSGSAYYYTFLKPHKNTFNIKPQFSLNSEKFFYEFEENEDNANIKYLGKIIEVEGKVVGIKKFDDNFEISLLDDMEGITCLVDSNYAIQQKIILNNIKVDDTIKVKGQCNGYLMGVKMDRCVVVE